MSSGFQYEAGGTKQNGAVALGGCPAWCHKQVKHARLLQRADHVVVLDKVPTRLSSTLEMVGGLNRVPSRLSSTLEMVDGLSKVGFLTGSPGTPSFRLACEQ